MVEGSLPKISRYLVTSPVRHTVPTTTEGGGAAVWIAPRVTIPGFMSVLQGSSVTLLPQGSTNATPRGMVCASGGLGAPRGSTRAPVAPLLWRAHR